MKCNNCGKAVPENAKFCKHCGSAVETVELPTSEKITEVSSASANRSDSPVEQNTQPSITDDLTANVQAKKRRSIASLVAGAFVLIILLLAGFGLIYKQNYKSVLTWVGLDQKFGNTQMDSVTKRDSTSIIFTTQTAEVDTTMFETNPSQTVTITEGNSLETTTENITGTVTTTSPATVIEPIVPGTTRNYKVVTEQGSPLRIRSGPSEKFEQVGKVRNGTVVPVSQIVDGWAYIKYNGITGWSSMQFLQPVD